MAGTKEGAAKTRAAIYEKYGADFYRRVGRIGGQNGHSGGFAANRELARIAGQKGGRISRRGKTPKAPEFAKGSKYSQAEIKLALEQFAKDNDWVFLPQVGQMITFYDARSPMSKTSTASKIYETLEKNGINPRDVLPDIFSKCDWVGVVRAMTPKAILCEIQDALVFKNVWIPFACFAPIALAEAH